MLLLPSPKCTNQIDVAKNVSAMGTGRYRLLELSTKIIKSTKSTKIVKNTKSTSPSFEEIGKHLHICTDILCLFTTWAGVFQGAKRLPFLVLHLLHTHQIHSRYTPDTLQIHSTYASD
ncbi:hypothetical protein NECID01_0775 [Nematocida sp. AWRm77]|nr:hypothetical protein NECID01_0775 [Nematocida sp. AWRm77]